MRTLNVDVSGSLAAQWVEWFAPAVQPFLASADLAGSIDEQTVGASLSDEVRDTYCLYGLPSGLEYVWLSEAQFTSLARPQRAALVRAQQSHGRELVPSVRAWVDAVGDEVREQADGHRFVWWRSLLDGREEQVLQDFIEDGRLASRHDEVPEDVWDAAAHRLPAARRTQAPSLPAAARTASGP